MPLLNDALHIIYIYVRMAYGNIVFLAFLYNHR
jgi:hypothetical protein